MRALAVVLLLVLSGCTLTPYWKDATPTPTLVPTATIPPNTPMPTPTSKPTPVPTVTPEPLYTVTGTANVRACPSTECQVVGYLYKGDTVTANCVGNWCQVNAGWVYGPCLGMDGVCK
jgi:hypothetical protein